jgi:hypothetical protein
VAAGGARAEATGPRAADWYTYVPGSDYADAQNRNAAFLQGLQELGWAVGRNVRIDYRWGASNFDPERMRKGAVELAALAPDRRRVCVGQKRPRGPRTRTTELKRPRLAVFS